MARWKTLLLAGALGCWPALGFAQANLPVPPVPPGDQGIPALPPGANTGVASVPVHVSGSGVSSRPARVSVSDFNRSGVPDITGMPKAESNMMYTGMGGMNPAGYGGDQPAATPVQGSFLPGTNFCAEAPVGVQPCGTTIHARGPSGLLVEAGVNFLRARRSDPSVLYRTVVNNGVGDIVVSNQSDYDHQTGTGAWVGVGYLTPDGWFFTSTYRKYRDTVHNDRVVNDGVDPNFGIEYVGPGPLGSGAGGGDVPAFGFLDRTFGIDWTNIDLMGGTVISPANCLDVIFAGGVRISRLEQNYDVFIDRGDGSNNAQALYSRLQGAGFRIGLETRVYPVSPLSLYAKAYSSLLYTNRSETAQTVFTGADGSVTGAFTTFNREEILPTLELGVGFDVSLFGGRVLVGGGYDFNYLWEAGSTYTEQSTNPRSARHVNLAIDGANFHVSFLW